MNLKCTCPDCNGSKWPVSEFRLITDKKGVTRYYTRRRTCENRLQHERYRRNHPKPVKVPASSPEYEAKSWKVICPTCGRKRKKHMLWSSTQKNPDGSVYVPRFRCKNCEATLEYAGEPENRASV